MTPHRSENTPRAAFYARIYLAVALFIIPVFGFFEGLSYLATNRREVAKSLAGQELIRIRNDLQPFANEERFLINSFTDLLYRASSPEDLGKMMAGFLSNAGSAALYAVFSDAGVLCADNFANATATHELLRNSGSSLKLIVSPFDGVARDKAIDNMRLLLGRSFFAPPFGSQQQAIAGSFFHADFADDKFRVWMGRASGLTLLIKLPTSELLASRGLSTFLRQTERHQFRFAIIRNGRLCYSDFPRSLVKLAVSELARESGKEFIEAGDSLFSITRIRSDALVLVEYRLPVEKIKPGKMTAALILLAGFAFAVFLRGTRSFRVDDLSVFAQISLLLIVSAGIPLAILAGVAVDYLFNKESALIREKNHQMHEFVQTVDQSLQGEYARFTRNIRRLASEECLKPFNPVSVKELFEKTHNVLKPVYTGFHMVRLAGPGDEKLPPGKRITSMGRDGNFYGSDSAEELNVELLGDYHLAAINGMPSPETSADRIYMLEMYFQKSVNMVLADMVKSEGTLGPAGWGSMNFLLFVEVFRRAGSKLYDLFLLTALDVNGVQEKFYMEHGAAVSRNPYGFRAFIARDHVLLNDSQRDLLHRPDVKALFWRVTDYPLPEPEIVEFEGMRHLFVGLRGKKADKIRFCVLFPVENIEKQIRQEALDLFYLAAIAGFLIFLMILILHFNLLLPIGRLHQAAIALENRDASFRLPQEGSDEFAEMAAIFNASMNEFEELKIASIVQARLLPARPLVVEGYSIYGRSQPMIELGGDYFDYFLIDENRFALLLGDVAGHGVAASLIMAMAKAGVICGRELQKDPAALLMSLHNIVFGIKNKVQRKVMTFQYLMVEKDTGGLVYGNAGGCSPVMFDPQTSKITEINHAGAVLGGFKKNSYSNLQLAIGPGQAMIFYTDGLVEARNEAGQELGYDGFYSMVADSYHVDAARYHERIMRAWSAWLGSSEAGDDLTMIVMVRNN
ncbi:MAG: SpoIIE family protein phosphatase [Candidatus Riflebacteria bacterium]|nr:SpoIIE family protein phosphatase [Candidatus Riflebacteria bacterium]